MQSVWHMLGRGSWNVYFFCIGQDRGRISGGPALLYSRTSEFTKHFTSHGRFFSGKTNGYWAFQEQQAVNTGIQISPLATESCLSDTFIFKVFFISSSVFLGRVIQSNLHGLLLPYFSPRRSLDKVEIGLLLSSCLHGGRWGCCKDVKEGRSQLMWQLEPVSSQKELSWSVTWDGQPCPASHLFLPQKPNKAGPDLGDQSLLVRSHLTVGGSIFAVRIVSFSRWLGGSDGEEFVCNAEDPGLTPGSGRFPQPPTQEKGMATHASVLAWRIPWTEEPGRLQSTGLQRVGSN